MIDDYAHFILGQDCLDPEMKKIRIEVKARALAGYPITNDELLYDALETSRALSYRGPIDPGPLTD